MTKADLMDKVAKATKLTKKDSGKAIDAIINAISGALAKGDKVSLVGFSSFDVRKRAAPILKPAKKSILPPVKYWYFKAGKTLKDVVGKNKMLTHSEVRAGFILFTSFFGKAGID